MSKNDGMKNLEENASLTNLNRTVQFLIFTPTALPFCLAPLWPILASLSSASLVSATAGFPLVRTTTSGLPLVRTTTVVAFTPLVLALGSVVLAAAAAAAAAAAPVGLGNCCFFLARLARTARLWRA